MYTTNQTKVNTTSFTNYKVSQKDNELLNTQLNLIVPRLKC